MAETKQCKHCKSEINAKAKRCPECQGDLRIWPARHKIMTGFGAFIILIIIIVAAQSDNKSGNTNNSTTNESSASQAAQTVDLATFAKEFDANKITAQDKYKDKYIKTTGWVSNISGGDIGGIYIIIDPAPAQVQDGITVPYMGTQIQCYLKDKADASKLTNGQQATVQGQVEDMSIGNIQFQNCSVVK